MTAKRLFLIFNHTITSVQQKDARDSLGVDEILDLPERLKPVWNQIPPDLPGISEYLDPIKKWLAEKATAGDYVLVQGDFGACYIMVKFAFEKGLVPIYSTTTREVVEEHTAEGAVRLTHQFQHRIFRKYGV
ncbi:MAG: hypothetical protein JRH18_19320 [Deltaproteobacteria bacterium]|nr:hypothetical protein [Deltaproteobacteria bacterium]MBW2153803.1 hypothetical protein [Deltaproteobacteria bacterium]